MELEDVQGRALFQLGDQSPYAAFFNLPYPPFYLTLKGYYGQAIKYQLNLVKFNARFNTFSGNYQVSLEFVGYKFNILNEISLGHLLAAPHMYSKTFQISNAVEQAKTNEAVVTNTTTNGTPTENPKSDTTKSVEVVSEKGYQKIVEVYGEYKSKGLIPTDFPELTLAQLMNKLEQFEQISGISFNRYQPYDVPITEYDKNHQAQWFMPDEYYYFDVKLFCLNKCRSLIEINRVNEEFTEYEERGFIKLLQWLKYFVDTCTEQNVLWGVGRGSSVSSYILYLIGVHRIDSIKYNLDWREFLR